MIGSMNEDTSPSSRQAELVCLVSGGHECTTAERAAGLKLAPCGSISRC